MKKKNRIVLLHEPLIYIIVQGAEKRVIIY